MKKLLIHIVFFLILEFVFIIFSTIYSKEIDVLGSVLWNSVVTFILFSVNLIKERKSKRILMAIICLFHLIFTILVAAVQPLEGDVIYLLVVSAPLNIPFLPWFPLGFESKIMNGAIYYTIFFYGVLLYWYFTYWLSEKIINKVMVPKTVG